MFLQKTHHTHPNSSFMVEPNDLKSLSNLNSSMILVSNNKDDIQDIIFQQKKHAFTDNMTRNTGFGDPQ